MSYGTFFVSRKPLHSVSNPILSFAPVKNAKIALENERFKTYTLSYFCCLKSLT